MCNFPKTEVGFRKSEAPVQTLENLEMKKTLVAIAAVAAATGAMAQSNVTMYGVFDLGIAKSTDNVNGRESFGARGGAQSGNRLGFKGTEDLGGGSTANFVIETGFDPSGNQTNLLGFRETAAGHVENGGAAAGTVTAATNRQSWVGLAGGMGEMRLGYQYTVDYTITSLSGIQATTEGVRGGNLHLSNLVAARATGVSYYAPKISGVQLVGVYGSSTDEPANQDGKSVDTNYYNIGAIYSNGPLLAALTTTNLKQAQGAGTQRTDNAAYMMAGSYDLKVVKLGATYSQRDNETNAGVKSKLTHYQISASYPMGKTVLLASYGGNDTKPDGAAKTVDVTGYQLGMNYNFSKRTNAYAYYGNAKDAAAAATNTTRQISTTVVGIRHQF
jgi:predicted porin